MPTYDSYYSLLHWPIKYDLEMHEITDLSLTPSKINITIDNRVTQPHILCLPAMHVSLNTLTIK